MKTLILSTMLFSTGLAFAAEGPGGPSGDHGHGRPHRHCVKRDKAKEIFNNLNAEASVVTHDKFTVTIKRNEGIVCREVTSDRGEFYTCCLIPDGDHRPDGAVDSNEADEASAPEDGANEG